MISHAPNAPASRTPAAAPVAKVEDMEDGRSHLAAPAALARLIHPGDPVEVAAVDEPGTSTSDARVLAVHAFGVTVDEDADRNAEAFVPWERVRVSGLLIAERVLSKAPAWGGRGLIREGDSVRLDLFASIGTGEVLKVLPGRVLVDCPDGREEDGRMGSEPFTVPFSNVLLPAWPAVERYQA